MKIPFRGRTSGADDFDEYEYEDEDFDSSPRPFVRRTDEPIRPQVTGDVPPPAGRGQRAGGSGRPPSLVGSDRPDGALVGGGSSAPPVATGPPRQAAVEPEGSQGTSPRSGARVVDERVVDEGMAAFDGPRGPTDAEQRSAWIYLGVLGVLFVLVVGFGYGFSGRIGSDPGPQQPAEMLASAEPVRLEFRADGDIVTLRGSVPDEAAREQLVTAARDVYGAENVVDSLVVDPETTLEEGSIRVIGSAKVGDERPATLQDRVSQDLGLANRGFEVGFVETVLTPVLAVVSINGSQVTLSGTVPDEQSLVDLSAIAGEVWGAANVDAAALVVGDTTWNGGRIQMAGTPLATDPAVARFVALAGERIGTLVTVETNGLSAGDDPALVVTQQATVDTLVLNSPIQFTPQSAEISPESESLLVEVAAALAQVPVTPVEIVGHTDSAGDEQANLVLSEDRAKAVMARLIALGVPAERLTARGEGANVPVADNATEEGRAANRRIQFILVGG